MMKNTIFNNRVNIKMKTIKKQFIIKNELKYFPMSEGNISIAEPNQEVLPLISSNKGLI